MVALTNNRSEIAKIKVLGIGGAGIRVCNAMINSKISNMQYIAVDTDKEELESSLSEKKLCIGVEVTRGKGAKGDLQTGREAAIKDLKQLAAYIKGSDMVFLIAGMGGGTGTGVAPIAAEVARRVGALSIALVTEPESVEGKERSLIARQGLDALYQHADSLITISNETLKLLESDPIPKPVNKVFEKANHMLMDTVQAITDIILTKGFINVDFTDLRDVFLDSRKAFVGSGIGRGAKGHLEAAQKAISNPFFEKIPIDSAKAVLVNITGGSDLSLDAVQDVVGVLHEYSHDDANIIFGAVIDPSFEVQVKVTIIATGFKE